MVELTSIFGLTETLAIIVGVIIALQQLGDIKQTRETELETRQAQLFMNIYNQGFTNPQFLEAMLTVSHLHWESLEEYQALLDYTNPETRNNRLAMTMLIGFYEGVGVLVKENLLDIRMVALLMTGPMKSFWEKLEPIVEERREYRNYPRWVSETEYLYNELMKYISEHPEFKV